jgi:integrase/recombinase XerD
MKTHEEERLGGWVRRFLLEHLVIERNLSRNTQRSYRDTLRLLIPFAADHHMAAVDRLVVTEVSADVVRSFLRHIEDRRGCGVRTRNQRLAAIHALAAFVGERCPELIPWCGEVRAVPFKRYDRPGLCYLDKPEIDALLAAPDRASEQGRRDHGVLLFLYNTGARASEAAAVAVRDLDVRSDGSGSVRLVGKGGKTRHCPLWPATMTSLRALTQGRSPDEPVFRNRRRMPVTRFVVHATVTRYAREAGERVSVARQESDQSARDPPHNRHAPPARGRGYQHDPRVVGPRLDRHDQRVCRSGSGDEGPDAGRLRIVYGRQAPHTSLARRPISDAVPP